MNKTKNIESKILPKEILDSLHKSTGHLIENNGFRAEAANSFDIQRRGSHVPGDTGNNFGMFGNDINGNLGLGGAFGETFPGSYFFSGFFGSDGCGVGNNFNGLGTNAPVQGSFAEFSRNTRLAQYKMAMCVSAYKGFGVAKNVIDLMANFAAEGLKIRHPNKTVEKFYQTWAEHVNLRGRVKDMLRYYYKFGNVFIYTTYGQIELQAYERMKRSRAKYTLEEIGKCPTKATFDSNDPEDSAREAEVQQEAAKPVNARQIPWRYTLLNPFQMELRGTKFFGGSRWVFILDPETASSLESGKLISANSYIDFLDKTATNLPPEFVRLVNKDNVNALPDDRVNNQVVELDQARLYTLHYMKDDHEDWADPILWPVMNDIIYKNKLRQMDISVANSVINAVTIFKLGSLKDGYVPPPEHFNKFAEFLRAPTQAMNMVWNDGISIESSYPPVEKILSIGKYESVDRDILRGIGVPDTLLGGEANSSFSNGFLGVRTLLERLEEGRTAVIRWLNQQLAMIAEIMGHRVLPKIRFGKMSLRDEAAEKQLILSLLDRNVISIEAVLDTFGEDFEIELERLREEMKIRDDEGIFVKHGPFTNVMAEMSDTEVMDKTNKEKQKELYIRYGQPGQQGPQNGAPVSPGIPKKLNGRPSGTKGIPQKNKRETKPQGMASLTAYEEGKTLALENINLIEKIVADTILAATNKKNKRSLNKQEEVALETITFTVASSLEDEVTLTSVMSAIQKHPQMDERIFEAYNQMRKENASLDERKVTMAGAISIVRLEKEDENAE